jgi:hypothetical protein
MGMGELLFGDSMQLTIFSTSTSGMIVGGMCTKTFTPKNIDRGGKYKPAKNQGLA